MTAAASVNHKQQLRFALSGLCSRDLEGPSVAQARGTLRAVRHDKQALRSALLDILTGIDAAPKHAARCRLQLAEFAVLECLGYLQLIQILPRLSQQANIVLSAHRQDAGCINSLAALLTSCVAKLLLEPQGSYAAIHGKASTVDAVEPVTADFLCEALLLPVINSTYRDPEQTRVSAGSVVLLGLFEVLKGHTDQAAVIEAVRRCLALMLQLMGTGTVAQRAPGVLLPVCSCVEVLGLSTDKDSTKRLLKLALKAATTQHVWQVRRDACQALAVLAASLQFRTLPPLEGQPQQQAVQSELVLTPAVELLITQKPSVMQVLGDVRFDKIAAVRTTAAAAWAEFTALPDPVAAADATPAGKSDKPAAGSRKAASKPTGASTKRRVGGRSPLTKDRKWPPPPRFVRPKKLPVDERDFGVLVFALPPPPPPPPAEPEPAEAADTSQSHGADQSPVARQLQFDADTNLRASVDAASQTCAESATPGQQPYTVQSPLSGGSHPFFATSSSPSPGHTLEQAEIQQLQQQLQQQLMLQQQQQSGLPALLAATGFGGSPVRLDISHHVHGRVEVGITSSLSGSPGAVSGSQGPSPVPQPASPASTPVTGVAGGEAAGIMSAMAAATGDLAAAEIRHSVQTIHPLWGVEAHQQQQQHEWQEQQGAWAGAAAAEMAFEPSFGPSGAAAGADSAPLSDSLRGSYASLHDLEPASAAAAEQQGKLQAPADLFSLQLPEGQLQQEADMQQQAAAAAAAAPDANLEEYPGAESVSPRSLASTGEQGRRQRQRWHLQPLSCSPGSQDVSEAPSRQYTPAAAATPPRSPSSLEVLRSVGERVQHLLETLSRQTSNSSRQGSRSPVASLPGRPVQGPPTSPGAPPQPRHTRHSSSCLSSNSSASTVPGHAAPGSTEAIVPAAAAVAADAAAAELPSVVHPHAVGDFEQLQEQLPAVEILTGQPNDQNVQQQQHLHQSQLQQLQPKHLLRQAESGGHLIQQLQQTMQLASHKLQQDAEPSVVEPCSPSAAVQPQLPTQWSALDVEDVVPPALEAGAVAQQQVTEQAQQLRADVRQDLQQQTEGQGADWWQTQEPRTDMSQTQQQQQQQQQHSEPRGALWLQEHGQALQQLDSQWQQEQVQQGLDSTQAELLQELQRTSTAGGPQQAEEQQSSDQLQLAELVQVHDAQAPPLAQQQQQQQQQEGKEDAGAAKQPGPIQEPATVLQLPDSLLHHSAQQECEVPDTSGSCQAVDPQGPGVAAQQEQQQQEQQQQQAQLLQQGMLPLGLPQDQPLSSTGAQWAAVPEQHTNVDASGAGQAESGAGPAADSITAAEWGTVLAASDSAGCQVQAAAAEGMGSSSAPGQQFIPAGLQQAVLPEEGGPAEVQQSSEEESAQQQHPQQLTAPVHAEQQQGCQSPDSHAAADTGAQEANAVDSISTYDQMTQEELPQQQVLQLLQEAAAVAVPEHTRTAAEDLDQPPTQLQEQQADAVGQPWLQATVPGTSPSAPSTAGAKQRLDSGAAGMEQPQLAIPALNAQQQQQQLLQQAQQQTSTLDVWQQSWQSVEQQEREIGRAQGYPNMQEAASRSTAGVVTTQGASLGGAAAADLGSFNMQYNELFQAISVSETADLDRQGPAASLTGSVAGFVTAAPGAADSAAVTGSTVMGVAPAVLSFSGGASGMSRVDQALEKLQSLRSTLRSISSSGAGHSSRPLSARGSLSNSRAASLQLGTREHSSSILRLPSHRSSGVLGEGSTGAITAGGSLVMAEGASMGQSQRQSETGSALASAKDWIRQISERLQQVGTPDVHGHHIAAAVDAAALAREAPAQDSSNAEGNSTADRAPGDVAAMDSAALEASSTAGTAQGGVAATSSAALALHTQQEAPELGLQDCQQLDSAVNRNSGLGVPAPEVVQAPAVPAEICDAALLFNSSAPAIAGSAAQEQLEEPRAGSPGWSTLTATTGSSSSSCCCSIGSQQLDNLVVEQLQGHHTAAPVVQDVDAAAAATVAASNDAFAEPDDSVVHADTCDAAKAGSQAVAHGLPQPAGHTTQTGLQQQQQQEQMEQLPVSQQQPLVRLQDPGDPAEAERSLRAPAAQLDADGAAVALVESKQRLQQLLSQSDDTMLLMAFALKLDKLGRKFQPHAQGTLAAAASSPLRLTATSGSAWQTPVAPCRLPGSPGVDASPAGPWTSITHNSLYNASPASTPQKLSAGAVPSGVLCGSEAVFTAAGMQQQHPADGCSGEEGEAAPASSLPVVAGPAQIAAEQQQGHGSASLVHRLHNTVLQSILGVGLDQLQTCSADAVASVALAMSGIQDQLQAAPQLQHAPAHPSRAHNLHAQLTLLKESFRGEVREHAASLVLHASLAPAFISEAENFFHQFIWPLVLAAVQRAFN